MKDHKDLDAWKHAMQLVRTVYGVSNALPESENYGLKAQLRRAAVSVPSNIAEGAARGSDAEVISFLYIARGSLAEVETQVLLAHSLGYLDGTQEVEAALSQTAQVLNGLIRFLKNRDG